MAIKSRTPQGGQVILYNRHKEYQKLNTPKITCEEFIQIKIKITDLDISPARQTIGMIIYKIVDIDGYMYGTYMYLRMSKNMHRPI